MEIYVEWKFRSVFDFLLNGPVCMLSFEPAFVRIWAVCRPQDFFFAEIPALFTNFAFNARWHHFYKVFLIFAKCPDSQVFERAQSRPNPSRILVAATNKERGNEHRSELRKKLIVRWRANQMERKTWLTWRRKRFEGKIWHFALMRSIRANHPSVNRLMCAKPNNVSVRWKFFLWFCSA